MKLLSLQSALILTLVCVLGISGCKDGPKNGSSIEPTGPLSPNTPDNAMFNNYDLSFITDGFLRKWSESRQGEARDEMTVQQEWIDFNEDGTYETGRLNETSGYGIWNFNPGNSRIQMTADDKAQTTLEFRVSRGDDRLVFMGTDTYQNEDIFILFNRMYDTLPQEEETE